MKRLFILLAIAITSACASEQSTIATKSEPKSHAPEQIKIATWNVEWLDSTPTRSQQERTDDDYKKLRAYAEQLNADVIGFQEVADAASMDKVLGEGMYNIIMSSRNNAQRTGFAIRKGIEYKDMGEYEKLGLGGSVRYGMDIMVVAGSSSIRLLNVHLKSFCFDEKFDAKPLEDTGCEKLNRQIPILDDWIKAREQEGVAYGILGDFNRKLKRDGDRHANTLTKEDGKVVLTFVGHEDASKCISDVKNGKPKSYPEFIDHISLSNKAMNYYVNESFTHHPYAKSDVANYKISDHCPLSVTLKM